MAFQTGTRINPALGNADFSGFARAAEIQAAALADFGAKIGKGIEKYREKKQEAADQQASLDFLKQVNAFPGVDDEALKAGIKSVGADNLVSLYGSIEKTRMEKELQEGRMTQQALGNEQTEQNIRFGEQAQPGKILAQDLSNQATQQNIDFAAQMQPLNVDMTRAQIEGMTGAEQRAVELFPVNKAMLTGQVAAQDQAIAQADRLNPIAVEQAEQNVEATKQNILASQAGISQAEAAADLAERKQALAEKVAEQTQAQNEAELELKKRELSLKVQTAMAELQKRDPISVKKITEAQEYLDENDLVMVDGAIYSESGFFGGTLTEVINPAILNLEGMEDLRRISMDMQDMRIVPEGAVVTEQQGSVEPGAEVSAAALDSVTQLNPQGSRFGGIVTGAQDLANATVDRFSNESRAMSENFRALPFAISDYLLDESRPTFEEARLRNLGIDPFSRSMDGRLFAR